MPYSLRPDDPEIVELTDSRWWACFRCSQPRQVVYFPPGAMLPDVCDCPYKRNAPHAGSHNCQHFEQIPGIDELWR